MGDVSPQCTCNMCKYATVQRNGGGAEGCWRNQIMTNFSNLIQTPLGQKEVSSLGCNVYKHKFGTVRNCVMEVSLLQCVYTYTPVYAGCRSFVVHKLYCSLHPSSLLLLFYSPHFPPLSLLPHPWAHNTLCHFITGNHGRRFACYSHSPTLLHVNR